MVLNLFKKLIIFISILNFLFEFYFIKCFFFKFWKYIRINYNGFKIFWNGNYPKFYHYIHNFIYKTLIIFNGICSFIRSGFAINNVAYVVGYYSSQGFNLINFLSWFYQLICNLYNHTCNNIASYSWIRILGNFCWWYAIIKTLN